MGREAFLILIGTLAAIKGLYLLRSLPWVAPILPTSTALLLIYIPVIHVTWRKIPITFFEKNISHGLSSIQLFLRTSLILFPPFLVLAYFYQTLFSSLHLHIASLHEPFSLILTQLFLVAFPEEFFFRGYLQTLVQRLFPKWIHFLGLEIGIAIPITACLFALSHSIITVRWWHFAIFFPSLVFGWLRQKTNGLVAPILFHALSNVVIIWIGSAYS